MFGFSSISEYSISEIPVATVPVTPTTPTPPQKYGGYGWAMQIGKEVRWVKKKKKKAEVVKAVEVVAEEIAPELPKQELRLIAAEVFPEVKEPVVDRTEAFNIIAARIYEAVAEQAAMKLAEQTAMRLAEQDDEEVLLLIN